MNLGPDADIFLCREPAPSRMFVLPRKIACYNYTLLGAGWGIVVTFYFASQNECYNYTLLSSGHFQLSFYMSLSPKSVRPPSQGMDGQAPKSGPSGP